MAKIKRLAPLIYILVLTLSFFYVRSVLKEGNLQVTTKQKEESIETKPVYVTLVVEDGKTPTEYKLKLRNVDSVNDLLLEAHYKNGFKYEKVAYTYGTKIDLVNGTTANTGYTWKVFHDDKDITYQINDYHLQDEAVYTVRLVKSD